MGRQVDYNLNTQQEWVSVVVPDSTNPSITTLDKIKWCIEVCHGRFTKGRIMDRSTWRYANDFRFKNKNDALMFKLTWGGNI